LPMGPAATWVAERAAVVKKNLEATRTR